MISTGSRLFSESVPESVPLEPRFLELVPRFHTVPSHFVDWTDENTFDISFRRLLNQTSMQLEQNNMDIQT